MSFSEWKESELGKIPVEWEVVEIDEIADVISGGTPSTKKSEYYGDEIAWITPKDLSGYTSKYISKGERSITNLGLENSSARLLPPNTVLFSSRAPIGYVVISKGELATNQGFKNLVCDSNKVDFQFMYYKMKTLKEALEAVAGGSTFKEVSGKVVKEFKIVLPTLQEQKAIANILSSLDEKIELNNQMNKTLEEMAQALFKRWFVDFEFPNEHGEPYKSSGGEMVDSELGMIPKGWEIKKIEEICEKVGSGGTPSRKKEDYYGGEILWLKTKELDDSFIFDTEEKITSKGLNESSAKLFPTHTVMMAMYGATVGKLGIISNELSFNQATCGMIINEKTQSYEYVYLWLLKERENIINLATGSAQQNLSVGVIKSYHIINPTLKQISDFKNIVKGIFEVVENNQKENKNLNTIRDTLLPKLMSGEIRVTDLQN